MYCKFICYFLLLSILKICQVQSRVLGLDFSCDIDPDGKYRHPYNCKKYFVCYEKFTYEFQCPFGSYFDEVSKLCTVGTGTGICPVRSIVREYNFEVSYFNLAPDQVFKSVLGVNGQFPGPTIRANVNDKLVINVRNSIQSKVSTTIHWHGIILPFNNPMDGPENVTQCPIVYGAAMRYEYFLNQTGTYWYHAHHSSQYEDGVWGILIVDNTPETYNYNDEFTITLSDWYHISSVKLTDWYLNRNPNLNSPVPDSILINGRGTYPKELALSDGFQVESEIFNYQVFPVQKGQTYRIRLINPSAMSFFNFSIDGHKLSVIEVDGVDTIQVDPVDAILLAPAMRYSILVEMNEVLSQYWIRVKVETEGFAKTPQEFNNHPEYINENPEALAILQYESNKFNSKMSAKSHKIYRDFISSYSGNGSIQGRFIRKYEERSKSKLKIPISNEIDPSLAILLNPNDCSPFDGVDAPRDFDIEIVLNEVFLSDVSRVGFNGISYKASSVPAFYQMLSGQSISTGYNPQFIQGFGKVVQLVVNSGGRHPFHLHGHTFWVVGGGIPTDKTNYTGAGNFDLSGVRRDTTIIDNTWGVLRFIVNNPGVWFFHCHIDWHLEAGLAVVFVEEADLARNLYTGSKIQESLNVCKQAGLAFNFFK